MNEFQEQFDKIKNTCDDLMLHPYEPLAKLGKDMFFLTEKLERILQLKSETEEEYYKTQLQDQFNYITNAIYEEFRKHNLI